MKLIPNIGLARFKLHPTRIAQENPVTCVLSHDKTAFYTVTAERMAELLRAEQMLEAARLESSLLKQSNESLIKLSNMPF